MGCGARGSCARVLDKPRENARHSNRPNLGALNAGSHRVARSFIGPYRDGLRGVCAGVLDTGGRSFLTPPTRTDQRELTAFRGNIGSSPVIARNEATAKPSLPQAIISFPLFLRALPCLRGQCMFPFTAKSSELSALGGFGSHFPHSPSVIACLPSPTLLPIDCSLLIAHCPLPIANCSLLIANCPL
jgi:hypothetical protein